MEFLVVNPEISQPICPLHDPIIDFPCKRLRDLPVPCKPLIDLPIPVPCALKGVPIR